MVEVNLINSFINADVLRNTALGKRFVLLLFSQSYDIGKMNVKYAPAPEVLVRCNRKDSVQAMVIMGWLGFLTVFSFPHNRPRCCGSSPLFI